MLGRPSASLWISWKDPSWKARSDNPFAERTLHFILPMIWIIVIVDSS